jgi:CRP-like cAMP-binding protein
MDLAQANGGCTLRYFAVNGCGSFQFHVRQEVIYKQGDPTNGIYFLALGHITAYVNATDPRLGKGLIPVYTARQPGVLFGDEGFIPHTYSHPTTWLNTVRVIDDSWVFHLSSESLKKMMALDTDALFQLSQIVMLEVQDNQNRLLLQLKQEHRRDQNQASAMNHTWRDQFLDRQKYTPKLSRAATSTAALTVTERNRASSITDH